MSKFQENEDVLIQWLPNDWRKAVIVEVWFDDKYFIKLDGSEITALISESNLKKVKEENKFFGD
jgi:hypothetical protein